MAPRSQREGKKLTAQFLLRMTDELARHGWRLHPHGKGAIPWANLGVFEQTVRPDFVARVAFHTDSVGGATAGVGVSFAPLERLRWLLTGDPGRDGIFRDLRGLVEPGMAASFEIKDRSGVDHAVVSLTALVDRYAIPFALGHASVEAFLADWQSKGSEFFDYESESVPALLAAAGRFDEARSALERYRSSGPQLASTRDYRRFARQLLRFLDANGQLPEPSEPPQWAFDPDARPERLDIVETWRKTRGRKQAFEIGRDRAAGHSRDQLRSMLKEELDRRGLVERPPWIESHLDVLERPELAAKWQSNMTAVTALIEMGRRVVNTVREGLAKPPEWLEPPDRAGYPMLSAHKAWTAVVLDPAARPWLDRVFESTPVLVPPTSDLLPSFVRVDVWLEWDPPNGGASQLGVYAGEQRVGQIDQDAVEWYRTVMRRAAERDELPWTSADLTRGRIDWPYLLEVPLPAYR